MGIDKCDKKPEEYAKAKDMSEEQLKKLSVYCRKGANAKTEKCQKLTKDKEEMKNMEEPSKKDAKFCSNPKNAKNKKCVAYNKQMAYQKKAKFCMQEENKEKEFCQKMPERDDEQTKNKKDFMTTMKEYCMENKESMKCKAFAMKMEKCCEEEGECGVSCDDGEAYDKEKKMCMPVACNAAEACGEDQKCVPFKAECERRTEVHEEGIDVRYDDEMQRKCKYLMLKVQMMKAKEMCMSEEKDERMRKMCEMVSLTKNPKRNATKCGRRCCTRRKMK